MAKKMSELERQYKKQVKRIRQFINRNTKRGFNFADFKMPEQPKTITAKSVQRLKSITPQKLYQKAKFYDVLKDKYISGTQAVKQKRKRAAQKAAQTKRLKKLEQAPNRKELAIPKVSDVILQNIEEVVNRWQPMSDWQPWVAQYKERDKNILASTLRGAIDQLGREQVARNVEAKADAVIELTWEICYGTSDAEKVQMDLVMMSNILWGRTISAEQTKRFEENTHDWADFF